MRRFGIALCLALMPFTASADFSAAHPALGSAPTPAVSVTGRIRGFFHSAGNFLESAARSILPDRWERGIFGPDLHRTSGVNWRCGTPLATAALTQQWEQKAEGIKKLRREGKNLPWRNLPPLQDLPSRRPNLRTPPGPTPPGGLSLWNWIPEAHALVDSGLWINDPTTQADILARLAASMSNLEQMMRSRGLEPGSQGFLATDPPEVFLLKESYNNVAYLVQVLTDPNHPFHIREEASCFEPQGCNGVHLDMSFGGAFISNQPTSLLLNNRFVDPADPTRRIDPAQYLQSCANPNQANCELHTRDEMLDFYTTVLVHEMAHRRMHEINYAAEVREAFSPRLAAEDNFIGELFAFYVEAITRTLNSDFSVPTYPHPSPQQQVMVRLAEAVGGQFSFPEDSAESRAMKRWALAVKFFENLNPHYQWVPDPVEPRKRDALIDAFDSRGFLFKGHLLGMLNLSGVSVYNVIADPRHPGVFEAVADVCGKLRCQRIMTHCFGPDTGNRCVDTTVSGVTHEYVYDGPIPAVNPAQRKMYFSIEADRLGFSHEHAPPPPLQSELPYPYNQGSQDRETGEPLDLETTMEHRQAEERETPPDPQNPVPPLSDAQREACRPPEGQAGTCVEPVRNRGGCNYSTYETSYDEAGNVIGFTRTDCFTAESDGHCVCSSPEFYGAPDYETVRTAPSETRVEIEGGQDLCANSNGGFSACLPEEVP